MTYYGRIAPHALEEFAFIYTNHHLEFSSGFTTLTVLIPLEISSLMKTTVLNEIFL